MKARREQLDLRRQVVQSRIDQLAKQRKLNNNVRVSLRRVNKRKYYGTGVEVKEYQDAILEAVNTEGLRQQLSSLRESHRAKEQLIDDIINAAGNIINFQAVRDKVEEVFNRTFDKGTRRVFNAEGETIKTPEVTNRGRIKRIISDQELYFKNMNQSAIKKTRRELMRGIEEGRGIDEITQTIQDKVEGLARNRAETIARTEVIKASNEGTKQSMEEAGIDEVMWLATMDRRTRESHPDGGGCVGLHKTVWKRNEVPEIPLHPNCRCVITARV